MPIKADVKIKQARGGSQGPRRVTVLFKLTLCHPSLHRALRWKQSFILLLQTKHKGKTGKEVMLQYFWNINLAPSQSRDGILFSSHTGWIHWRLHLCASRPVCLSGFWITPAYLHVHIQARVVQAESAVCVYSYSTHVCNCVLAHLAPTQEFTLSLLVTSNANLFFLSLSF